MAKTCPLCGKSFPDSAVFCLHDGTSLKTLDESDDLINQTFCDRYIVTECLGQGGMGAVYLARDVRLPQKVAIKVLRERTAADPALVARFRQEADAASRINHDRIARVFDFGFMEDGRAYIVMEYADGKTLKQMLDDGPLEPPVAARITVMIAEGLGAAHRLGILHRDLKPDNVMVLNDASSGLRVKVLDFGIAKILGASPGEVKTETGFVIGTPLWMSPEQLLAEPVDARSDIFTLGLLAFSMLTGARAFTGGTRQAEMMAPLSSTPRSLQAILPGVQWPRELQTLFTRTLSRNANERPSSALDFANEMSRILNNAPVAATMPVEPVPPLAPKPLDVVPVPRTANTTQLAIFSAIAAAVVLAVVAYFKMSGTMAAPDITIGKRDATPVVVPFAVPAAIPIAISADTNAASVAAPTANSAQQAQFTSGKVKLGDATGKSNTGVAVLSPDVAKLRQLMMETDESVSAGLNDEAKTSRAQQQLRDFKALKLTSPADQGWQLFYQGTLHATLNDTPLACGAFDAASKVRSPSATLKEEIERWQLKLACPP
ncbi:MAG: serine/threonine-protein kinase [Gemmatimonas sp.]